MEKEISSEKQRGSKVFLILAIIFYVIGGALVGSGIYMFIKGFAGNVNFSLNLPSTIDPDFYGDLEFDEVENGMFKTRGIGLFMGGMALILIATMFIAFYKKPKIKVSHGGVVVDFDNPINIFTQTPNIEVKEEKKETKKIFCAYCGSELDINDKKCPNCGSTKKVQRIIKEDGEKK